MEAAFADQSSDTVPVTICYRGRFQKFDLLATLHQKKATIVIIIYTTDHVQSLSSFGTNFIEIFKVAKAGHESGSLMPMSILMGILADNMTHGSGSPANTDR